MKSSDAYVSVLMCVKDGDRYIEETISSVLSQTHKLFEFIIVVNCSTDNTLEVIEGFLDSRLIVLQSDICQLSYNLNLGLSESKYDYIVRIDADDLMKEDRIQLQLDYLLSKKCDVVGSNVDVMDNNSEFLYTKKYPENNQRIRRLIIFKSVLCHPSVMFKKHAVLSVGGYMGGRVSEDYDLWLRLMRNKQIIFCNIPKALTLYRVHGEQAKGNPLAYAEVASYSLREFLISLNPFYLLGMFLYIGKFFYQLINSKVRKR